MSLRLKHFGLTDPRNTARNPLHTLQGTSLGEQIESPAGRDTRQVTQYPHFKAIISRILIHKLVVLTIGTETKIF